MFVRAFGLLTGGYPGFYGGLVRNVPVIWLVVSVVFLLILAVAFSRCWANAQRTLKKDLQRWCAAPGISCHSTTARFRQYKYNVHRVTFDQKEPICEFAQPCCLCFLPF